MSEVKDSSAESGLGLSIKPYAPRIFISATSRDLGSYRQLVRDELLTGACLPVVQEHFPPDPRTLSSFLEDRIRVCDAVICLLGPRFGAAPEAAGAAVRSYTQMEYDTARELNKDIYVFLAAPACRLDDESGEAEDKMALQREHVRRVQERDGAICKLFSSREELRAHILRLLPSLAQAKLPKYWVQSPSPYPYFAGREAELRQLTEAVTGSGPSVVVVMGVAGQGKTTLAWEWFSNHCPDVFAGAFWCPAEENEYTFDMFVDLALAYLRQGNYDKRSFPGIQTRIRMLLQHLRDRPCLLAVDGLEKWLMAWTRRCVGSSSVMDSDSRLGGQDGLDLFLGQLSAVSGGSRVILTSRVLPAALDSAPHAVIPVLDEVTQARLQGLDDAAAVVLLRKLGVKGRDEDLLGVARDFEKHPLSLTILGKLSSRKYGGSLEWFRGENGRVAEDERLRGLLDKMQQALPSKEDSVQLLDLLAHFIETPSYEQFSGFLRWMVLEVKHATLVNRPVLHLDDDALREGLAVLDDWSLITWDRQSDSLHLHALLREYFKSASVRSKRVHDALAEWYLTREIAEDAHSLKDMRGRILAVEHGLQAENAALCDAAVLAPVSRCSSLPEWLALWGHQSSGIELLGKVLVHSREQERSKHLISRGAMLENLGKLASAREDLAEAVRWLSSGLWKRLKHREILAGAYMNRGNALAESGRPDESWNDFNTARKTLTWPLGLACGNPMMMGDILVNRGGANRDLGRLTQAEQDATAALHFYRKHVGTGATSIARVHSRIACALLNRGNARANGRKYEEADQDYCAALQEISCASANTEGRAEALRALIRIARGLLLSDKGEWRKSLLEYGAAINALSELVRHGNADVRTTLGLALSNRAESLIALGSFQQAIEDVEAAKHIYGQVCWEDSSKLAVWVAANETTLEGLGRILKMDISIGKRGAGVLQSWESLSRTQGLHLLAPFVRANTGIARLVFEHDRPFSAKTVSGVLAMIEDGVKSGYWSEWLVWEVYDLREFVAAHREALDELGVPVQRVQAAFDKLSKKANQKGISIHATR